MGRDYRPLGFVYLIGAVERHAIRSPLKVGITDRPKQRLTELQIGSPLKLEIIQTWRFPSIWAANGVERKFHRQNKAARSHGEWFFVPEENAKLQIRQLVSDYWKMRRRKSPGGTEYYQIGNVIAVAPTLSRGQAQLRRAAHLAGERASST